MRYEYRQTVGCENVGSRVTVRSRTGDGLMTDVVGVLERCDERSFHVRTRRGELVAVDRASIVASKVVPPAPPPRRK